MSAAPQLNPNDDRSQAPGYVAGGRGMSVREAAAVVGVSESTLRRTIKQAADVAASPLWVECDYRGQRFTATRAGARTPWQIVFATYDGEAEDVSAHAVARVDGRIAELRVAMLPMTQERPLEHVPDRPWWKFWAKG